MSTDAFTAIVEPRRRQILDHLRAGPASVNELVDALRMPQPAVSKHLRALKTAGLVQDRHQGRQTHYSARSEALAPLVDWTGRMAGFWESRFDDLEDLMKRMDQ